MDTLRLYSRITLLTLLLILLIAPASATLAQEEATAEPTAPPTEAPTEVPTELPTEAPTEALTEPPTAVPTEVATEPPTAVPTESPTIEVTPEATLEVTPLLEVTAEATLETLLAPAPLVARVEPVTDASLMAAQTFVVNSVLDDPDMAIADGICDTDPAVGNQCTLRAAIQNSNFPPDDKDTINFNIPGTGPHTINTLGIVLQQSVIINATTQPGYTWATPQIVLDGGTFGVVSGVLLGPGSSGSTIKGLVINGGWDYGIQIDSANNLIQANFIGTNATGTAADGNLYGIFTGDSAAGNTIGGTSAALRNVISGNTTIGVLIFQSGSNRVQGNIIGTDRTGAAPLGNNGYGVKIDVAFSTNTIGGTVAGARNVISGNGSDGVYIFGGSPNLVQGNYIGLRADGSAALGNGGAGVNDDGFANVIGGTVAGARNVISGNGSDGVIVSSSQTVVQGNYIGTNAAGTASLGNNNAGVLIDGGGFNTIGGTVAGARNVISGNLTYGVRVVNASPGNRIQGNYIGTNPAGAARIPNDLYGIIVGAGVDATLIGGTVAGARNVISGNDAAGILIVGDNTLIAGNYIGTNAAGTLSLFNSGSGITLNGGTGTIVGGTVAGAGNRIAYNTTNGITVSAGSNHRILSNLIYANSLLGIDLVDAADPASGVTANDTDDGDPGVNDLQNYPVLTDMRGSRFVGSLNSNPNRAFRLQFFASPACDPSSNGEGQRYLGTAFVMTDAGGDASFNLTLPYVTVTPGWAVTATATVSNPNVETSEFSRCILANLGVPALVSPANGAILTDTTPTLKWGAVPYAQDYFVEVSLSPTFMDVQDTCSNPPILSCDVGPLEPLESYYWHVRAVGIGQQFGPWSVTRRFDLIP